MQGSGWKARPEARREGAEAQYETKEEETGVLQSDGMHLKQAGSFTDERIMKAFMSQGQEL